MVGARGISTSSKTTKKPALIASLDVGSSKVTVAIGIVRANPQAPSNTKTPAELSVEIVGVGSHPCAGVRQGSVINVEATIEAINKAREEAEMMAGYQIDEVFLGVGGSHIKSFDSRGMIAIRNKEVKADDIERVIAAATAVAVPSDRVLLHVLPRDFQLDEQPGISDPLGMTGVRLEANVHIVTAAQSAIQNLMKCAEKAGLKVKTVVLQQLASAVAVLSEDEKKLGAAVIDMGGGTCDLILYAAGSVAYTASVPVGGQHVTQDISMGLRTPQVNAENIKCKHGNAIADLISEEETIEVESVGGRKARSILRKELGSVIEPRAEEILNMVWDEVRRSGLVTQMGSGMVLTGGASKLEGLVEMGEFLTEVPVRRGVPEKIGGLVAVVKSPEYSTAVGLLIYGIGGIQISEKMDIQLPKFINELGTMVKDFFGKGL